MNRRLLSFFLISIIAIFSCNDEFEGEEIKTIVSKDTLGLLVSFGLSANSDFVNIKICNILNDYMFLYNSTLFEVDVNDSSDVVNGKQTLKFTSIRYKKDDLMYFNRRSFEVCVKGDFLYIHGLRSNMVLLKRNVKSYRRFEYDTSNDSIALAPKNTNTPKYFRKIDSRYTVGINAYSKKEVTLTDWTNLLDCTRAIINIIRKEREIISYEVFETNFSDLELKNQKLISTILPISICLVFDMEFCPTLVRPPNFYYKLLE